MYASVFFDKFENACFTLKLNGVIHSPTTLASTGKPARDKENKCWSTVGKSTIFCCDERKLAMEEGWKNLKLGVQG